MTKQNFFFVILAIVGAMLCAYVATTAWTHGGFAAVVIFGGFGLSMIGVAFVMARIQFDAE